MLKKKEEGALLATVVSVGALAASLVAATPAGAAGVKAAGPSCTADAHDHGTCTLKVGSIGGGTITFVAHDNGGSMWTISDATQHTVLQTGDSSASGTLTSGWNANDSIQLSIGGKGSLKATWKAGVRKGR